MTIDDLLDIESIKHLRALGSKYLDSGDLEALVDLYTEDAVSRVRALRLLARPRHLPEGH